ncbi:MAG: acyltransferase [Bacteroidota bacterium]|nr:acyltransferase [Bacteroidota bacterium]
MHYLKSLKFIFILLFDIKKITEGIKRRYYYYITNISFIANNIDYSSIDSVGIPIVQVAKSGKCEIGENFACVNNAKSSTLGINKRCKILVYPQALLKIGSNVAMSNTTIVATNSVEIGNNVMIGGGVTIMDSDFHSLNPIHWRTKYDEEYMKSRTVTIGNNVFIGMGSIILKGVRIGTNVIIAAGSVVSRNIPDNQIWGGNPAVFIKNNVQTK